jgi:hypothetical protein
MSKALKVERETSIVAIAMTSPGRTRSGASAQTVRRLMTIRTSPARRIAASMRPNSAIPRTSPSFSQRSALGSLKTNESGCTFPVNGG